MNTENKIKELTLEAKRVLNEEIESLKLTLEKVNEDFANAALKISESKKLIVSGVGKSGIIGRKIAATFSSIGIPAFFLNPVEALHGDIGSVQQGDCVLLLSKSGSTEEIVRLVPFLKGRKSFIISITGNSKSFLATNSDINLDGSVIREACPLNITPTSSTTVALAIGDALAACVMKINNVTIKDFSRQHPLGQLGRNITLQVKDVMHQNDSLPLVKHNSSFKDSLIHITSKGLGCACIVDEHDKLIGILTDGDIRRVLQKYEDFKNLTAFDVMTSSPISITGDTFLGDALTIMENRPSQINVLPVVDEDGKCIGVVRLHDIIRSGI